MNNLTSSSDFNTHNLIIPDIKIDDLFLHSLLGLNYGIVNVVDHYISTFSSRNLEVSNIEQMSDLENPIDGQTHKEFKKMLKYFEKCEDVFIEAFKSNGFSHEEAINQWVIYANIINLDSGSRFLRITLRYSKQNTDYQVKLAKSNPKFKEKIDNINKFGFDVSNQVELIALLKGIKQESIKFEAESSGCMFVFIIILGLSFLIKP